MTLENVVSMYLGKKVGYGSNSYGYVLCEVVGVFQEQNNFLCRLRPYDYVKKTRYIEDVSIEDLIIVLPNSTD
jgi:hypothetical protein